MASQEIEKLYVELTSSRSMTIREEHDVMTWVATLEAKSRRELSRKVKERNWRKETGCGADCTGRVFSADCELLRGYRVGNQWIGVVVCSEYRDV